MVAIGRASRRFRLIGSPVTSQKAVVATFDPAQGGVDLRYELALPIAGPQFKRAVGLFAGTIGNIGHVAGAVLQAFERLAAAGQDLGLPVQKLAAEIFQLPLTHERLVFGRR
jgi:hypothetical protein